jgi:hypothetical protein
VDPHCLPSQAPGPFVTADGPGRLPVGGPGRWVSAALVAFPEMALVSLTKPRIKLRCSRLWLKSIRMLLFQAVFYLSWTAAQ